MNRQIKAPVRYLPEYLYQEPVRVLRGCSSPCASPAFGDLMRPVLAPISSAT